MLPSGAIVIGSRLKSKLISFRSARVVLPTNEVAADDDSDKDTAEDESFIAQEEDVLQSFPDDTQVCCLVPHSTHN